MRMWMVPPETMCRKHLLGEHVELHMFTGAFAKGVRAGRYATENLLEWRSILKRHSELVVEMERRGYRHTSPLESLPDAPQVTPAERAVRIDRAAAVAELHRRCPVCRSLHAGLGGTSNRHVRITSPIVSPRGGRYQFTSGSWH